MYPTDTQVREHSRHTLEAQQRLREWQGRQMKQWFGLTFRDDAPMAGPPSCTAADFKVPRLRRCPFGPEDLVFEARVGGGADGCVWKVRLGQEGPFALKMFWDFEPPKSLRYWAVQRECQNAALLQMMETAVEQAVATQRPVLVIPDPASHDDAKMNQAAFCDEGRQHQPRLPTQQSELLGTTIGASPESGAASDEIPAAMPGIRAITTIPRMRKCYGWLTLPRGLLDGAPSWLRAPCLTFGMKLKRFMQHDQEYPAILYEYVEDGENDPSRVQEALDFFWLAGFSATMSPLARNWKSNVLLDLSDIVPARGFGWKERYYKPRDADIVLSIGAGVNEDCGFDGYRPPHQVVARAMALKDGSQGPPPPRPQPPRPPWAVRDRHAVMTERRRIRGLSRRETPQAANAEASEPAATTEPAKTTKPTKTTELSQSSPSSSTIPGLMPTRLRPRPARAANSVPSPAKRGRRSGAQGREDMRI